jgi:hypothetical protein
MQTTSKKNRNQLDVINRRCNVYKCMSVYIQAIVQTYPLSFDDKTQVAIIVARSGLGRVVWWAWWEGTRPALCIKLFLANDNGAASPNSEGP